MLTSTILVFLIAPCFVPFLEGCSVSSFEGLSVLIKHEGREHQKIVDKCIDPNSFNFSQENLEKIIVSDQKIPNLNKGAVRDIWAQFSLVFKNNVMDTIKEEAFFNLTGIYDINLDKNGISWLEENAFSSLPTLEVVDLEGNGLEMLLQNTFYDLPNLTTVSLAKNRLEIFKQDWFYKTPKLEMLLLGDNLIRSLSRAAFITMTNLQYLDLNGNLIETIHRLAFDGSNNLKELMLDRNRIKTIDVEFARCPKLTSLGLIHNNITYISEKVLGDLEKSLKHLWVNSNPFQCACFDKILKWSDTKGVKVSWKCRDKSTVCVIPKKDPHVCCHRLDEDFYNEFYAEFNKNCQYVHD